MLNCLHNGFASSTFYCGLCREAGILSIAADARDGYDEDGVGSSMDDVLIM